MFVEYPVSGMRNWQQNKRLASKDLLVQHSQEHRVAAQWHWIPCHLGIYTVLQKLCGFWAEACETAHSSAAWNSSLYKTPLLQQQASALQAFAVIGDIYSVLLPRHWDSMKQVPVGPDFLETPQCHSQAMSPACSPVSFSRYMWAVRLLEN